MLPVLPRRVAPISSNQARVESTPIGIVSRSALDHHSKRRATNYRLQWSKDTGFPFEDLPPTAIVRRTVRRFRYPESLRRLHEITGVHLRDRLDVTWCVESTSGDSADCQLIGARQARTSMMTGLKFVPPTITLRSVDSVKSGEDRRAVEVPHQDSRNPFRTSSTEMSIGFYVLLTWPFRQLPC
ncbi:hypothetical protein BC834DRAFT_313266 [Gloeopeniophorella convolvens]|nr:hypothetical protein BC834DRAFT_313266 [Gloeopeniophorella convolvens]